LSSSLALWTSANIAVLVLAIRRMGGKIMIVGGVTDVTEKRSQAYDIRAWTEHRRAEP
jgi:hypothetical protein